MIFLKKYKTTLQKQSFQIYFIYIYFFSSIEEIAIKIYTSNKIIG